MRVWCQVTIKTLGRLSRHVTCNSTDEDDDLTWADPDGKHKGHVPPPNQWPAEVVRSGRFCGHCQLDSKMH